MFIIVSEVVPMEVDFREIMPKTIENLEKEKIFCVEIPASNDSMTGKVLARYISEKDLKEEFLLTEEEIKRFSKESDQIYDLLKKGDYVQPDPI